MLPGKHPARSKMASDQAREGSIEIPDEPSTSIDPYEILQVAPDATPEAIRTAYRKAALKHHPDKVAPSDVSSAKQKFQQVASAYAILSDPKRRQRYDRTGSTSEILEDDADFDWHSFFRAQYREIDGAAIEEFSRSFKESDEERAELLGNYAKYKGNMDRIYESTTLSNVLEDDKRFRRIINEAIAGEEVEAYQAYTTESKSKKNKRILKAKREAKEAAEAAEDNENAKTKKNKTNGDSSGGIEELALAIQKNKQKSMSFLDDLEAKYAGGAKGKGKRKEPPDEPPEEAFEAVGRRANKKKK